MESAFYRLRSKYLSSRFRKSRFDMSADCSGASRRCTPAREPMQERQLVKLLYLRMMHRVSAGSSMSRSSIYNFSIFVSGVFVE